MGSKGWRKGRDAGIYWEFVDGSQKHKAVEKKKMPLPSDLGVLKWGVSTNNDSAVVVDFFQKSQALDIA